METVIINTIVVMCFFSALYVIIKTYFFTLGENGYSSSCPNDSTKDNEFYNEHTTVKSPKKKTTKTNKPKAKPKTAQVVENKPKRTSKPKTTAVKVAKKATTRKKKTEM